MAWALLPEIGKYGEMMFGFENTIYTLERAAGLFCRRCSPESDRQFVTKTPSREILVLMSAIEKSPKETGCLP